MATSNSDHSSFAIGDVVILKSGSPTMTVVDIGDYGPLGPNPGVKCFWFVGGAKKEDVFDPRTLSRHSMP